MKAQTIHREQKDSGVALTRAFREQLLSMMQFDARNPEVQTRYAEVLRGGRPGPAASFSGNEANPLFHRDGARYEEIGATLGLSRLEDGRGLAIVDLDNDGAQDVVIHNFYRNPLVALLNRAAKDASWMRIRLRGTASNRFGIGARVEVGGRLQELACGMGYQSGNAPELHFGLGTADRADVRIRWPSGQIDTYPALPARRVHTLSEGAPGDHRQEELKTFTIEADPVFSPIRPLPVEELKAKLVPPPEDSRPLEAPALVIAFSIDCHSCVQELRRMPEIETRAKTLGLRVVWAGLDDPKRVAEDFLRNGALSRPWTLTGTLPTPTVYLLRPGRSDVFTGRFAVDAALQAAQP